MTTLKNRMHYFAFFILLFLLTIVYIIIALFIRNNAKFPVVPVSLSQNTMKVSSSAFSDNSGIPDKYTCIGENVSPGLSIENIPAETKSLALIVEDIDAPSGVFTHWLVWAVDPGSPEFPEALTPSGSLEGKNSFGKIGYGGPCPSSGTHHYIFRVFALNSLIDLSPGSTRKDLENAIEDKIITESRLLGIYSKN